MHTPSPKMHGLFFTMEIMIVLYGMIINLKDSETMSLLLEVISQYSKNINVLMQLSLQMITLHQ